MANQKARGKKKVGKKGSRYAQAYKHDYGYYRRYYNEYPKAAEADSKYIGKHGLNEAAEGVLKDRRAKTTKKRAYKR